MEKSSIIQDYCSDIICCPWVGEETMNHLALSAALVEDEITPTECNAVYLTAHELADYIKKHISICSSRTMDDVYFLLIQMANILEN